jgi:hypothetical protein
VSSWCSEQENNHELRSKRFAPKKETALPPQGPPNKGAVERPVGAVSGEPAGSPVGAQPQVGGEAGISLNREATEAGRALRGLPEAKEVLRREFGESAKIAEQKEAQYPGYGARVVDRISKGASAADDIEHAAVLDQLAKAQDGFLVWGNKRQAHPDG